MKRTVSIIGAGRVGRELGRRLRLLGWRIGGVISRRPEVARAAIRWIGAGHNPGSLGPELFQSDLILVTVPDGSVGSMGWMLGKVANGAERRNAAAGGAAKSKINLRRCVVLHTSGSLSHEPLLPLAESGVAIGAMHPMQTFGHSTKPDFRGTVFGLDGDPRAVRLGRQIAKALGGTPVEIAADKKAAYHCAGGFAAQHVLAVIETGVRLLCDVGLDRAQATRSLVRMARQTLDNLEQRGPAAAWSGPVARGDFATVNKHLEALRNYPDDYRAAYEALTRLVIQLVAEEPARVLEQLDEALRVGAAMRKAKRVRAASPRTLR